MPGLPAKIYGMTVIEVDVADVNFGTPIFVATPMPKCCSCGQPIPYETWALQNGKGPVHRKCHQPPLPPLGTFYAPAK